MSIGAYVLLADPAFLASSLRSYYDMVDTIAIVYDESALSWTGKPLPLDDLLATVKEVDSASKCTYLPGNFHDPAMAPLDADTAQRRAGIAALNSSVDWILQIDTDEVLGSAARLEQAIRSAEQAGRAAVEFPARWIYAHVRDHLYLERCTRLWGICAGFPGPIAVRRGTELTLARQCDQPLWRVDFRRRNTDPAHPRDARVDGTVGPQDGIWHFSWVRSEREMRLKATTSGHVGDFDWSPEIDRWKRRQDHPWVTTLLTPLRSHPPVVGGPTWLRTVIVPDRLVTASDDPTGL